MTKAKSEKVKLPVLFKGQSSGKKTTRIGIDIDRDHLKIAQADKFFTDTRLSVKLTANSNGSQEGQGSLPGMDDKLVLVGSADVKGFKTNTGTFGIGLTFNRSAVKQALHEEEYSLDDFVSREGTLEISGVEAIPDEEEGDKEADADDSAEGEAE